MENEQNPQPAYLPPTPPTAPGAVLEPVPVTKWPKVLGVISIILGVLGALGAVWGVVGMTVMSGFMQSAPPEVLAQLEQMKGWTIAASILSFPVCLLLLATGIGLVSRRQWSITTAKIWAVLKMLLVVFSMGMTWQMQGASFRSNPAMAGGGNMVTVIQAVSMIFGLAWGWALPVFMLIWLSRTKIKTETAAWK